MARRLTARLIVLVSAMLLGSPLAVQAGQLRCFVTDAGTFGVDIETPIAEKLPDGSDNPDWVAADSAANFSVTANGAPVVVTGAQGVINPATNLVDRYAIQPANYDRRLKYTITPAPAVAGALGGPVQCVTNDETVEAVEELKTGWLQDSDIAPKYAENGEGEVALGIDFDLKLASDRLTTLPESWSGKLATEGYLVLPGRGTDSDLITTSLDFGWDHTSFPWVDEDAIEDEKDLVEALGAGKFDPLAARIELRASHNTKQDFGDYDITVGLGGSATVPFPRVLDTPILLLPLALLDQLSIDGKTIGSQQPYLSFSVDYVAKGLGIESGGEVSDDEDYFRGMGEFAWTGEYFARDLWLYANARIWIPFDAPANVDRVTDSINHFIDVGLKVPVGLFRKNKDLSTIGAVGLASASDDAELAKLVDLLRGEAQPRGSYVVLKYTHGELPPFFETDEQVSVGFQVDF